MPDFGTDTGFQAFNLIEYGIQSIAQVRLSMPARFSSRLASALSRPRNAFEYHDIRHQRKRLAWLRITHKFLVYFRTFC
jgi:hypothetical protein